MRPAQPPLHVHDPAKFLARLASLHEKRRAKAAIEEARRRKREQDTQAAKGTPTAPPTWKVPINFNPGPDPNAVIYKLPAALRDKQPTTSDRHQGQGRQSKRNHGGRDPDEWGR